MSHGTSCRLLSGPEISRKGVPDARIKRQLARRGRLRIVRRMFPANRVLLALLLLPNLCEAYSGGLRSSYRRRMLSCDVSASAPPCIQSISLEIHHRDHEQSPLRRSHARNSSLAQRLKKAALRSRQRTQSIRNKIRKLAVKDGNGTKSLSHLLDVRLPVFAQQGEFIASIRLGTPAEKFVVILDSGSDLVWVQCKPCQTCITGMPDPLFDPFNSPSYKSLPCASSWCNALSFPSPLCHGDTCPFVMQYGDGTTAAGELATDTITFGLESGNINEMPDFAFGCGADNTGDLAGSDGILGIGKGPFSLPSQLSAFVGNKFSFCLVSAYEATTKTSPFVLGNGSFFHASGSRWTPILRNDQNPSFYYVQIDGIKVDGKALRGVPSSTFTIDSTNGNGGTIIDTGTTFTELLSPAYEVLASKIDNAALYPPVDGSGYGLDLCWDTTNAPQSGPVFPLITFQFRGANFDLPPNSAYIEVHSNIFCLTFMAATGMNIIGNLHMQNVQMFFNNDDNLLGWKPANCGNAKL